MKSKFFKFIKGRRSQNNKIIKKIEMQIRMRNAAKSPTIHKFSLLINLLEI